VRRTALCRSWNTPMYSYRRPRMLSLICSWCGKFADNPKLIRVMAGNSGGDRPLYACDECLGDYSLNPPGDK
jgi:hypothetical protein